MKKIILIPDSFKGTMSSIEVCDLMEASVLRFFPDSEVIKIPVADGGEGSVDCFMNALGGIKVCCGVKDPFMADIKGFYCVLPDGTAVIETAAAAGLSLAKNRLNPAAATTYGVGQLVRHALENGSKKIIIGLGGSATNDAACGMAAALGVKFFNSQNEEFIPVGGNLSEITRIDMSNRLAAVDTADITAMCDIDNPLYGTTGAAYVFAPQKGADEAMVRVLDSNLKAFSQVVQSELGINIAYIPGAGAAGGMGGGVVALLGARLVMGIDTILDITRFEDILKSADMVFTGEGKFDSQSLHGKVIIGVARKTKAAGVPLIAVVGDACDGIEDAFEIGVDAVFSINNVAVPFEKAKERCRSDLSFTMDNIMRLARISRA